MENRKTARPMARVPVAFIAEKKHDNKEDVKEFAYALYEKRGHVPGNQLQDWFDAEKAFRGR